MNEQYKFLDYIAYSVFFLFPPIFLAVETFEFVEFPAKIFIFVIGIFTIGNILAKSGFLGLVKNFPGTIFAAASILISMSYYWNQLFGPYPYELFGSTICVAASVICIGGAISTYRWKGQTTFGEVAEAGTKHNILSWFENKARGAIENVKKNIAG